MTNQRWKEMWKEAELSPGVTRVDSGVLTTWETFHNVGLSDKPVAARIFYHHPQSTAPTTTTTNLNFFSKKKRRENPL